jgi:hypothetical protein
LLLAQAAVGARLLIPPPSGDEQTSGELAKMRLMTQAVWKLKKSKRDENDILGFDFKIEWACGVGAESALNG